LVAVMALLAHAVELNLAPCSLIHVVPAGTRVARRQLPCHNLCCCTLGRRVAKFNGVHSIDLYIPENFGADYTEVGAACCSGRPVAVRRVICCYSRGTRYGRGPEVFWGHAT
jgi:hypothetical protein